MSEYAVESLGEVGDQAQRRLLRCPLTGCLRRLQVTLVELVSQNLLCDSDKGGLVGGDLQEFRVGHRAVIGSKGLLLPSHKLLRSPQKNRVAALLQNQTDTSQINRCRF